VGSDPVPDERVSGPDSDGSIADANPGGKEGRVVANLLEMETRMVGVLSEEAISLTGLTPNMGGEA